MAYNSYGKYMGSYNSLNPSNASSYGEVFTGYEMTPGRIGSTTNPQTANQVNEVIARMNEGTKTVEIVEIDRAVFEATPQEQFKQIRQLSKLANITPTMHAPIVDRMGYRYRARRLDLNCRLVRDEEPERADHRLPSSSRRGEHRSCARRPRCARRIDARRATEPPERA